MAASEAVPEACCKRRGPDRLDCRKPGQAINQSPRARLDQSFPERRRVAEVAGRYDDPIGWFPAELLHGLQDDRFLTFQSKWIDRVEQVDAQLATGLVHQLEAAVEVASHDQHARSIRDRLRHLADGD